LDYSSEGWLEHALAVDLAVLTVDGMVYLAMMLAGVMVVV